MSAENLTALASIVTAGVIAASAIAALIQLRHMRSAHTLNAMLELRSTFNGRSFLDAATRLRGDTIARAMENPEFLELLGRRGADAAQATQDFYQSVMLVLNWYETFGALLHQGVLSMSNIGDTYASVIDMHWRQTEPVTRHLRREFRDDAFYEMFEYLTVESRAWMAAHPSVYPPHLARLIPTQEMLDAAEAPKAL